MLFYVNPVTIFPPVTACFKLKNAFVVVVVISRQHISGLLHVQFMWSCVHFAVVILLGHLRLSAFLLSL